MQKLNFEEPIVEIISFSDEDIITMSAPAMPGFPIGGVDTSVPEMPIFPNGGYDDLA